MDGGKNARPGHRELRQPYSSAAQAIGLAIRPLRRFVDFSSIIERTAGAAGSSPTDARATAVAAVSQAFAPRPAPAIGALNLDPIEIRITSQYCTGL